MTKFVENIYNYFLEVQDVTWMILIVMGIIIGLMFLVPIKRVNDFAKEHIVLIIIGAFMIFAAVDLGTGMATSAGFYTGA